MTKATFHPRLLIAASLLGATAMLGACTSDPPRTTVTRTTETAVQPVQPGMPVPPGTPMQTTRTVVTRTQQSTQ
ncbi:MAG: hypothetical protein KGL12_14500 [Rhodospirillales bacterium]|nr:hypothetical protein [Rhodospirillales bacterium]